MYETSSIRSLRQQYIIRTIPHRTVVTACCLVWLRPAASWSRRSWYCCPSRSKTRLHQVWCYVVSGLRGGLLTWTTLRRTWQLIATQHCHVDHFKISAFLKWFLVGAQKGIGKACITRLKRPKFRWSVFCCKWEDSMVSQSFRSFLLISFPVSSSLNFHGE